jgi:hypothetical protein
MLCRCSITPDVLQHRDELSQFVGDEISRIIQEQRQLETRYEELIAQRGTLKVRRSIFSVTSLFLETNGIFVRRA